MHTIRLSVFASPFLLVFVLGVAGCKNTPPGSSIETCIPGETLIVGCAQACGLGMCEGNGSLRVCDGSLDAASCRNTEDTASFVSIQGNDCSDTDSCPRGRLVCPPSGSITVVPRESFGDFRCDWELEHRGILPPGGRSGETITCEVGAAYEVGCTDRCNIGECVGSPELNVCDGDASIADCAAGTIAQLQGGSSWLSCRCPRRIVECPASGRLTIAPVATGEEICEWDVRQPPHREDGSEVCSPGQRIVVGCAQGCGLGECTGESLLRVCDGNTTPADCLAATDDSMWLVQSGGSSCDDECAEAALTCPGSGAITVVTHTGTGEQRPYACQWAMRVAGIGE